MEKVVKTLQGSHRASGSVRHADRIHVRVVDRPVFVRERHNLYLLIKNPERRLVDTKHARRTQRHCAERSGVDARLVARALFTQRARLDKAEGPEVL